MYSLNGWRRLSSRGYLVILAALVSVLLAPAPVHGQLPPRAPVAPLIPVVDRMMQPSIQQTLWMLQAAGTGDVYPGGFGGGLGGGFGGFGGGLGGGFGGYPSGLGGFGGFGGYPGGFGPSGFGSFGWGGFGGFPGR